MGDARVRQRGRLNTQLHTGRAVLAIFSSGIFNRKRRGQTQLHKQGLGSVCATSQLVDVCRVKWECNSLTSRSVASRLTHFTVNDNDTRAIITACAPHAVRRTFSLRWHIDYTRRLVKRLKTCTDTKRQFTVPSSAPRWPVNADEACVCYEIHQHSLTAL